MPRNITVTWEDMWWEDDDEFSEPYDVRIGGFVIDGWTATQTEDMTRDDLIAMHKRALQDLDAMIECEFCVEYLILDEDDHWVSALTKSNIGMNRFEELHHYHKPERLWYEIFVDILEEYGAVQSDGLSFYSEHHTRDYRLGIERQYAVHIEWNITEEESDLIDNEINLRAKNRANFLQKLS